MSNEITTQHRMLGRQLLQGPIKTDTPADDRAKAVLAAVQSDARLSVLSNERSATIAFKNLLGRSGLAGELGIDFQIMRNLMRLAATSSPAITVTTDNADPAAMAVSALLSAYPTGSIDGITSEIRFKGVTLTVQADERLTAADALSPGDLARVLDEVTASRTAAHGDARFARMTLITSQNASVSESRIFNGWTPRIVSFEGMKTHPFPLVEANTLASVRPRALKRTPFITKSALGSGAISDAQAEAIALAVNAHDQMITIQHDEDVLEVRRGFLLADGTGAGKSTTSAGIIADAHERGYRRHIVVLEKQRHIEAFRKALRAIGAAIPLKPFKEVFINKKKIELATGIVAVTYSKLRQLEKTEFRTAKALALWMNGNSDGNGVIVFDEAQNLRNAEGDDQSLQGAAGLELDGAVPNSRIVYASATGATQIENLGYMRRLGLWGPTAIHGTFGDFVAHLMRSSSLETLAIDLKSKGLMTSRTLSLAGVTYTTLDHMYTTEQRDHYEKATSLIAETLQISRQFVKKVLGGFKPMTLMDFGVSENFGYSLGEIITTLVANIARTMVDTLETAFLMPTVIETAQKAIAEGYAPVIQISSTGAAELERQLNRGAEIDDIRLGSSIIDILEQILLPATRNPAMKFSQFETTICDLISRWKSLPPVSLPLDQLLDAFGPEGIAEMSGRKKRRIKTPGGYTLIARNDNEAQADHAAFMNGLRQAIVFTTQYGGTGYDYDANAKYPNKAQRRHIIVETSNQVDQVVQGIGRTHRSSQVVAPIVELARSDLPGESIRNAAIQRNIARLGALSMGHRDGASRALFDHIEDITSLRAQFALTNLYRAIADNKYEGLSTAALRSYDIILPEKTFGTTTVQRTFRRLRLSPLSFQQAFFDAYLDCYRKLPEHRDTYDTGAPLPLTGKPTIASREEFHSDPQSGQWIDILKLNGQTNSDYIDFDTAMQQAELVCMDGHRPMVKHRRLDATIMIQAKMFEPSDVMDPTVKPYKVFTPQGATLMSSIRRNLEGGSIVTDLDYARKVWNERIAFLQRISASDRTMLVGSLLILDALMRHKRRSLSLITTDKGESLVGYVVNDQIVQTLREELPSLESVMNAEAMYRAQRMLEQSEILKTSQGYSVSMQIIPASYLTSVDAKITPDPTDRYVVITMEHDQVKTAILRRMRALSLVQVDLDPAFKTFIGPYDQLGPTVNWALRIAGLSEASAAAVGGTTP